MIVSCPKCSARFRVSSERLAGKKVGLRCARCKEVFSVPGAPVVAGAGETHVLVAHSDPALCRTIGDLLSREQIDFAVYHDGEAALNGMALRKPQVAVVDVALPGLFAFEVVEKVRSRPGLEDVKIILLSSVYNKMAYKRRPSSLYGADDYIEKHHLPDDLVLKVTRLASPQTGPDAPEPSPPHPDNFPDDWEEMNETIRHAEEQEVGVADHREATEKARRLARIIVSDIALYNQDKVESGVADGNFYDLLAAEIAEGQRLFAAKTSPELLSQEDFLQQAFEDFIIRQKKELAARQEN